MRLFISGESWRERTRQILGLDDGAPPRPALAADDQPGAHHGHSMEFWRIDSAAEFAVGEDGLMDAAEAGLVLADRALALSEDARREDVLILAHGPEDDAENARWLARMEAHADAVREAAPFNAVAVATLREDWPDKREAAEARVRAFVADAAAGGRRALVVPFRVHGFGPYADVLEGLDYVADGRGLVPHQAVTDWIARQADALTKR
jgi:hypothetical protein